MTAQASKYRINLVRKLREQERLAERRKRLQVSAGLACFAVLALALGYSGYTIWKMESVIGEEERKLAAIQAEYRKYTAARAIVDKSDVELLHSLQGRGILWTKKLAAMATHLPDQYAITDFSYRNGELRVAGYGYLTPRQDQLLVLDGYLNRLRKDSAFSDVFKDIRLNSAAREEDAGSGRFGFEFTAINPSARKAP